MLYVSGNGSLDADKIYFEGGIVFACSTSGMTEQMTASQNTFAEITDVIKKVKEANNNVRILLSIMMYRDQNDEYITLYNDFTEDINAQLEFLNAQSAQGGGDFPEAVEVAFAKAAAQQWTSGTSTKILVHVADAPAHNKDVASWAGTVDKFASLGVRILTIASSGIDKQTAASTFIRVDLPAPFAPVSATLEPV